MVAQEISPGFTQLLHQSHEPQEYITLEELGPRLDQEHHNQNHQTQQNHQEHQDQDQISTPTTYADQLYRHQNYQQPSYYNLMGVQE